MSKKPNKKTTKALNPLRSIDDIDDPEFQEERIKSVRTEKGYWIIDLESGGTYAGCKADPRVKPRKHSSVRLYGKGFGYIIRGCAVNGKVIFYRTAKQQEAINARERKKNEREIEEAKEDFQTSGTMEKPRAKFTVKPEKQAEYDAWRAKNSDPYGGTCFLFAEKWAELMETALTENILLVSDIAKECEREADKEFGITGFMYGMAVNILSEAWIYGDLLRKWHNDQYGESGKKANETGGTVNPAVFTVTTKNGGNQ